jgi:hypothetical protein
MAKLNISLEGNSLGEFNLDKERITIGRRVGNDIHIDNLAVSGDHAIITTIGNDSFLQDLDSTNGTLVNGKSIKKHVLHHGDIIGFGRYQIEYVNLTQQKSLADRSGFENTAVMRPAKLNVDASARRVEGEKTLNTPTSEPSKESATQAASAPPAIDSEKLVKSVVTDQILGHLQVLNGVNAGHELLLNKALTTLGKPGLQVAVITKRPHGYFITHVEGKKMPLVNGHIIGAQAHALSDHDVIDLEGIKMEFHLVKN